MIVRNRGIYRIRKSLGVVRRLFTPLSLSPYQWTMMETGLLDTDGAAASSGDSISVVQNLGSGASNYLQDTGTDQPKYHTTKGIYLPPVSGNVVDYGSFTVGSNETWEAEVTMMIPVFGTSIIPYGGNYSTQIGALFDDAGNVRVFSKGSLENDPSGVTEGVYFTLRCGYDGTDIYTYIDEVEKSRNNPSDQSSSVTFDLNSGWHSFSDFGHSIKTAKLTIGGAVVQQTDYTTQHHNATSITPTVGGTVTISQAGNDPATVVEYPFTRHDGVNSFLEGTYDTALDGGYMFLLYSVVGDGGDGNARAFVAAPTGSDGSSANGALFIYRNGSEARTFIGGDGRIMDRASGYAGTGLHEVRLKNGAHKSLLNGAGELTDTTATTLNLQDFGLGADADGGRPAAIDVFVHGLFDEDISDANATKTRDYVIAKRPNLLP
jgi:hypothetical protein